MTAKTTGESLRVMHLTSGRGPRPLDLSCSVVADLRSACGRGSFFLGLVTGTFALLLLASVPSWAATVYWDTNGATAGAVTTGTSANGNWGASTTGNWTTNAAGTSATVVYSAANGGSPATADVFFSAGTNATGISTITIVAASNTGVTAQSITIQEGAIATATSGTFSAGPVLTLGSGGLTIASTATGASSFNSNTTVLLAADQAWTNNSGSLFTAGGTLTGAASLAETLTVGGTGNMTLAGAIANGSGGTLGLAKNDAGTLLLSGANTFTGPIAVTGGILQFGKAASLYNSTTASWTAANISVSSGATLAFNVGGTGEFTTGNVTTLLANLTVGINNNGLKAGSVIGFDTSNSPGSSFTIADNIADSTGTGAGSLGLTKLGANTLVLSGTNSYTGVTTVNAGTLSFSKAAALYGGNPANWTASNIIVNSGATLAFGVGGATGFTTSNVTTLLANLTTGLNNNGFKAGSVIGFDTTGGNFTVANIIADSTGTGGGSLAVTKLGTNTLTLSGNNTYTGVTTVSTGTVNVSGDNSLATGGWNITGTANFQSGSTINVASGKSISLSAGSGALTSSGTVVNDGSLSVSRANTVTIAGGSWTQNGAMSVATTSATAISSTFNVTGGSFTYAGSSPITLRGSDNSGGGSASINVNGPTAVFITGKGFAAVANTVGSGLNSSANVTLDNGGTLKLSANVTALGTAAMLDPFNFKVGSTGAGGIIDTNGFNTTLGVVVSNLSGAGKLTKAGDGTLTLGNTNTYTGATTVTGGTLVAGALGRQALGATTTVAVTTGGSLLLGSSNQVNDTAGLTLNNGTFATGGASSEGTDTTAGLGALTLSGSSSIIDFGTGTGSLLHFADSSAQTWTGSLSIYNWSGVDSDTDRLFFGSDSGALTAGQLSQISFYEGGNGSAFLGNAVFASGGELEAAAIPEPSSSALLAGVGLLGFIGWRERRRLRSS